MYDAGNSVNNFVCFTVSVTQLDKKTRQDNSHELTLPRISVSRVSANKMTVHSMLYGMHHTNIK